MPDEPDDATAHALRPIDIRDGVVTRPAGPWTPTVHAFLRHLRAQGLESVPEPLGTAAGTETLGYLAGASGGDGWFHQHTEVGLRSAAALLRRLHDASAGWRPPAEAVWGAPTVPGPDQVFCHGDPGPWNFVWDGDEAVGLLDWDFLHPAPRVGRRGVRAALVRAAASGCGGARLAPLPGVPDRRSRVAAFLDAYGPLPAFDVTEAVASRAEATIVLEQALAEAGVEPQRTWVAEGSLDRQRTEVRWIREHGGLWT